MPIPPRRRKIFILRRPHRRRESRRGGEHAEDDALAGKDRRRASRSVELVHSGLAGCRSRRAAERSLSCAGRTGDVKADVAENTRRMTRWLEKTVAAHPDQWNWFTVRWQDADPAAPQKDLYPAPAAKAGHNKPEEETR